MSGDRHEHREVRNGRCSVCRYAQGGEASWFHCPHNPDGYLARQAKGVPMTTCSATGQPGPCPDCNIDEPGREQTQRRHSCAAKAVALHFEFAEDWCCDPVTYSAECTYRQVCHECGQDWPCDTSRVAAGGEAVTPGRRDG